jgi:hydroxymethylglutaryl-CoA lyase
MQGWKQLIPTAEKIRYINALLDVGFHTIDFGSFVSPKLVPQMADTAEVIRELKPSDTGLLAIVANRRGAEEAIKFDRIGYLGFPFSISETFQQRNTNSSREESLDRLTEIMKLCKDHGREIVVYMSMGFGNPYGDAFDTGILSYWMQKVYDLGARIISLADTVGVATADQVKEVVSLISPQFSDCTVGVHLHSTPAGLQSKLLAAIDSGCKRIDGAIAGIGGCPMAGDELVGNMDTGAILNCLMERGIETGIDMSAFRSAEGIAKQIFKN